MRWVLGGVVRVVGVGECDGVSGAPRWGNYDALVQIV